MTPVEMWEMDFMELVQVLGHINQEMMELCQLWIGFLGLLQESFAFHETMANLDLGHSGLGIIQVMTFVEDLSGFALTRSLDHQFDDLQFHLLEMPFQNGIDFFFGDLGKVPQECQPLLGPRQPAGHGALCDIKDLGNVLLVLAFTVIEFDEIDLTGRQPA